MDFPKVIATPRSPATSNQVERLLQLHICALAFLGSVLLGMGQESPALPMLVLFAAVTSYWFTDRFGWFHLNRLLAYLAMLAAAFFSLGDFFSFDSHEQLMAIASLLVYVQIVLMYQKKSYRIYEQLAVFCLLQVVVAAILNVGFQFGILLIVYLLLALSALSLFFLYREGLQFAAQRSSIVRSRKKLNAGDITDNSPIWKKALGSRPVAYFHVSPASLGKSLLGWVFARHVIGLCIVTVLFTTIFFYSAPRMGRESWQQLIGFRRPTVGFSPEPSLDDMGKVLQNNQVVMRVAFFEGDNPLEVLSEPYLRGVAATRYESDGQHQRWTQAEGGGRRTLQEPPEDAEFVVRQLISLEPTRRAELFSLSPAFKAKRTPEFVEYIPRRRELRRTKGRYDRHSRYQYTLATTALRFGIQASIVPHLSDGGVLTGPSRRICTDFDEYRFPKLRQIADEIIREENIDLEEDRLRAARAIRNHFRTTKEYEYTLTLDMRRDRSVDPIEAFVADHQRGHCLYFASALTMMLRSQNIPARLVLGYKPDEFNSVGNYFVVRQRHAHAWVEAYLEPHQIPDSFAVAAGGKEGCGAWIRLDPTPGTSDEGNPLPGEDTILDRVNGAFDYAQLLWNDYVLAMNANREEDSDTNEQDDNGDDDSELAINSLTSNTIIERFYAMFVGDSEQSQEFRSSFFRPFVGSVIAIAIVLLVYRVRESIAQLFARLTGRRRAVADPGSRTKQVVDFYERFEALCERLGVRRKPAETQLEFAVNVSGVLARSPNGTPLPRLPRELVQSFYQVRFGRHPLDNQQREVIENALSQFEQAIWRTENGEQ